MSTTILSLKKPDIVQGLMMVVLLAGGTGVNPTDPARVCDGLFGARTSESSDLAQNESLAVSLNSQVASSSCGHKRQFIDSEEANRQRLWAHLKTKNLASVH